MEDSITCRGPCKKVWARFGRSSFLRHVKQAKKCKAKYSEIEVIEMEKASGERTRNLKRQRESERRQHDSYDSVKRKKRYEKNREHDLERQRNVYAKKTGLQTEEIRLQ